jgi:hypothetical protein
MLDRPAGHFGVQAAALNGNFEIVLPCKPDRLQ